MNFNNTAQNKFIKSLIAAILFLLIPFVYGYSQDSTEKKKPLLSITYYNVNSDSFFVKVSSGYKDEKFFPIEYQNVKLYLNEADKNNFLGDVMTDPKGEGIIHLPQKFKGMIDSLSTFDLVAETDADVKYKAAIGSTTIENAFLDVQIRIVDTTKMIRVYVYKKGAKVKSPIKGVEMSFFVKRMVGLFPLSDKTISTDSAGMAEMEYAITDMPGDSLGAILVGAKIADADTYGNIFSMKETFWGAKTFNNYESVRALWAPADRVPVWLIVLALGIIITVWGTILFIIYQVYRIFRLGQQEIKREANL